MFGDTMMPDTAPGILGLLVLLVTLLFIGLAANSLMPRPEWLYRLLTREKNRFMGVEITAKTLGIIGCGNIGSIVADRAIGLKMKVIACDPFLSEERARDLGVEKVELDALFKRADFITLHTPLTEKTKNIIHA